MVINKINDTYFKINSSLTDTKLCHSVKKVAIFLKFLKYLSLLVRQHQKVVLATLYRFVKFLD